MRLFLILSYYFSLVWAIKRKSLGFGPINPNAVFHSTPTLSYFSSFITDPFDLAHHFIQSLNPTSSYHIRKDSYTDPLTGVSHIYVRQLINGLEVVDGDININIKDSTVLSYGNSFYNGPIPTPLSNDHITSFQDIHKHSCDLLTPDSPDHLFNSNCHFLHLPSHLSSNDLSDFRPALLKFIIAATPHHHLAAHILDNFQSHMDRITVTPLSHLVPSVGSIQYSIDNVPDTVSPVLANMAYIQVPNQSGDDTELHLVWKFEVEMIDNWYETAVSASPPHNIISVVDWASDAPLPDSKSYASYNVFKWGVNDPTVGNRSFEKESFDAIASPAGWHALPYSLDPTFQDKDVSSLPFWRNTTSTWGNNVFAQENWKGQGSYIQNLRPDAGHLKVFDYSYDPQVTEKTEALEEAQKYIDAAVVQLFYTTNLVHDLYYRYGFHELSGNFQQYNFDKGGEESDAIIANAQDGSGYNNANFMTPPDGRNGRMRMYLWNTAVPFRDGDLEAGIVIHELSHGLSTRMTGGPANSGCLGWGEAGGMGEGWGDFLATTVRSNETYADYPMGAWAANLEGGIRHHIYSRDKEVNPSTYKTLDKPGYWGVHAIGEVWAEMLWVVSQKLIAKHGYSPTLFPPTPYPNGSLPADQTFYRPQQPHHPRHAPLIPAHGNTLTLLLLLNALKLQPCRPSFFEARDALVQADQILTGGENYCTIWEGFAERGLGEDATVVNRTPWGGGVRTDGFAKPVVCRAERQVEVEVLRGWWELVKVRLTGAI